MNECVGELRDEKKGRREREKHAQVDVRKVGIPYPYVPLVSPGRAGLANIYIYAGFMLCIYLYRRWVRVSMCVCIRSK